MPRSPSADELVSATVQVKAPERHFLVSEELMLLFRRLKDLELVAAEIEAGTYHGTPCNLQGFVEATEEALNAWLRRRIGTPNSPSDEVVLSDACAHLENELLGGSR